MEGQQVHRQTAASRVDALALDVNVQWQLHPGGLICGFEVQQAELSLQQAMPMLQTQ